EGGLTDDAELRLLDLQSNFLWQTDSTFLPTPAISNILVGYTIPASGGNTEFVSTRAGWARLPDDLRERARSGCFPQFRTFPWPGGRASGRAGDLHEIPRDALADDLAQPSEWNRGPVPGGACRRRSRHVEARRDKADRRADGRCDRTRGDLFTPL